MVAEMLADAPKEFVFDGGPLWRPERALDSLHRAGLEGQVPEFRANLAAAQVPARRKWLEQRLASFFVLFNPTREVDSRAFAVWNDEMARLLGDLPHDILAWSIDQAIKVSNHGFMPSVGEIRAIADPLVLSRAQQIDRLRQLADALANPDACAERDKRRRERELHAAHMARADGSEP